MADNKWRACGRKKRYHSRGEANIALKHLRRRGGIVFRRHSHRMVIPIRAYLCKHCKGWHLTHRRTWD